MRERIIRWNPSKTLAGALTWGRDCVASKRKLALAAVLACTLAAAGTAFANTSGLFYSDFHLKAVQDASDNGTGVTPGSVNCPSSHPTATGGGAENDHGLEAVGRRAHALLQVCGRVPGRQAARLEAHAGGCRP